jgi:alkylated DNA repair dioxygenase AlkB
MHGERAEEENMGMLTDKHLKKTSFSSENPRPDVVFVPGFLSRDEADTLLETIRAKADFRQNPSSYPQYPRPRLEAWYGTWDYHFSGTTLPASPVPGWLQVVFDRIEAARIGHDNGVLLNRYRGGKDSISPHSDDDYGDPSPTIPTLVLGAARPLTFAKKIKGTCPVKVDKSMKVVYEPGHGDLLVMRGRTNAEWQHWIPKTAKPVGERISLTFRNKRVPET